jgi:tRNA-dependent cyclodipeptide synthase
MLAAQKNEYKIKTLKRQRPGLTAPELRLGISIENPNHSGEKFAALLRWATERFGHTSLLIADSLQRHNIAFNEQISLSEAHTKAVAAGDFWLQMHQPMFDILPNFTLYRFDDFRTHHEFEARHKNLLQLYSINTTFRNLIDQDSNAVLTRRLKRGLVITDQTGFLESSRNYILEELAVMQIFHETCPGVEAYPGKFLSLISAPERLHIEGLPESLKQYPMIEVDFVRNRAA